MSKDPHCAIVSAADGGGAEEAEPQKQSAEDGRSNSEAKPLVLLGKESIRRHNG